MTKLQEIEFKGNKYLLIDGAITTKFDYENGLCSYANIYGDVVKRYGKEVGKKADIKFTRKSVSVSPKVGKMELLFNFVEGLGGW